MEESREKKWLRWGARLQVLSTALSWYWMVAFSLHRLDPIYLLASLMIWIVNPVLAIALTLRWINLKWGELSRRAEPVSWFWLACSLTPAYVWAYVLILRAMYA